MGVTIESKNYSLDLGYGGFLNLRKKGCRTYFDRYRRALQKARNRNVSFRKRSRFFF